jgi:hypothetical protein
MISFSQAIYSGGIIPEKGEVSMMRKIKAKVRGIDKIGIKPSQSKVIKTNRF